MDSTVNIPSIESTIKSDGVVYMRDSGERTPMSVVWTTLPGISFLFPVIGHVGIGDSRGIIFDFSGPYQVTIGSLMCGPAKRVWRLDSNKIVNTGGLDPIEAFDAAITKASCEYGKRMHRIVFSNCHSYIATVLNQLKYDGRSDWNQVSVFLGVWGKGRWVNRKQIFVVFSPFLILMALIVSGIVFPLAF